MRGLGDVSVLAAAAALAIGLVGAGCSGQETSVDSAPPAEERMEGTAPQRSELERKAKQEEEERY